MLCTLLEQGQGENQALTTLSAIVAADKVRSGGRSNLPCGGADSAVFPPGSLQPKPSATGSAPTRDQLPQRTFSQAFCFPVSFAYRPRRRRSDQLTREARSIPEHLPDPGSGSSSIPPHSAPTPITHRRGPTACMLTVTAGVSTDHPHRTGGIAMPVSVTRKIPPPWEGRKKQA